MSPFLRVAAHAEPAEQCAQVRPQRHCRHRHHHVQPCSPGRSQERALRHGLPPQAPSCHHSDGRSSKSGYFWLQGYHCQGCTGHRCVSASRHLYSQGNCSCGPASTSSGRSAAAGRSNFDRFAAGARAEESSRSLSPRPPAAIQLLCSKRHEHTIPQPAVRSYIGHWQRQQPAQRIAAVQPLSLH